MSAELTAASVGFHLRDVIRAGAHLPIDLTDERGMAEEFTGVTVLRVDASDPEDIKLLLSNSQSFRIRILEDNQ